MIKTLVKSLRPSWASKNVNMYLLALTYAYFTHVPVKNPLEILGGLLLISILWGALYSLNDLTDLEYDRKDHNKKERAFIQENVDKKWIILFVGTLLVTVFAASLLLMNLLFTLILGLMVLNQLVYTMPPVRLKDSVLAPLTSTGTNTVLRIASCCVLLGNLFLVPLSVYILMFIAGTGTYIMYKSKTTTTNILSGIFVMVLIYVFLSGDMNFIQFGIAVLPSFLATIPLYLSTFRQNTQKDRMLQLADVLYHRVALAFYLICIFIILFPGWIPVLA